MSPELPDIPVPSADSDLMRSSVRGGAFVFVNMLLQKGLNLATIAVLARLLTPEDYGMLGMLLTLTALLQVFADMGLPLASVQKADLTYPQLSAMFWMNLCLGVALAVVTLSSAPLIAAFYHQPLLAEATRWYSLTFLIVALGAQHGALLQRRMAFDKLAYSELAGVAAGAGAGIWMACRGAGFYALIGQQIALNGVTTLGKWYFAGWIPRLRFREAGALSMVKVGGFLTAFNLVNHFTRNLDNILVGRYWGAGPVGLYTRAYALMTFPMTVISEPLARVAIPALAKLQNDLPRLRLAYLRVLKVIGFVTFPLTVLMVVAGDDIVRVCYGKNWSDAVPMFRVLCIAGMWQGIYHSAGQVYVATGRTDRMFKAGVAVSAVTVSAFFAGLKWGAIGVAVGYAAAFSVIILPYLAYTYATAGLSLSTVLRELRVPFGAAVGMAPFLWGLRTSLPGGYPPICRLGLLAPLALFLYFLFLLLFGRPFLIELKEQLVQKDAFRFGKSAVNGPT